MLVRGASLCQVWCLVLSVIEPVCLSLLCGIVSGVQKLMRRIVLSPHGVCHKKEI